MSKREWKIGDTLRCLTANHHFFRKGEKVTVTRFPKDFPQYAEVELPYDCDRRLNVRRDLFELVEPQADCTVSSPGRPKEPNDFTYEVEHRRPSEGIPNHALDLDLSLGVTADSVGGALRKLDRKVDDARSFIVDAVQHLIVEPEQEPEPAKDWCDALQRGVDDYGMAVRTRSVSITETVGEEWDITAVVEGTFARKPVEWFLHKGKNVWGPEFQCPVDDSQRRRWYILSTDSTHYGGTDVFLRADLV